MKLFKTRKRKYTMDMDAANTTLQNVFASCDKKPNSIPFDKIVLRTKLNTLSYKICIAITIVLLAATIVLPIAFHPALYHVSTGSTSTIILEEHFSENNELHLELSGDGILYPDAYMIDSTDSRYNPLTYDVEKGILVFPFPSSEANIYIPSEDGTTLHLLVTPD